MNPVYSEKSLEDIYEDDAPQLDNLHDDGALDPVYQAKVAVINEEMQRIGMGKYQWQLFVVAGFGWFADIAWGYSTGSLLPPTVAEFNFKPAYFGLAYGIGSLAGAIFWGVASDVWGRRFTFNSTLFIAGVFALAAGGSPNFVTLASLVSLVGFGIGGNIPVDSAVFLEFLPASHQYLLAVLIIWWCSGQFLASLIIWPLMANFSCPTGALVCAKSENMGWRYLLFALGGLTMFFWIIRFFAFTFLESPRLLIGFGRDEDAVAVIHKLAAYNGKNSKLTVDDLSAAVRAANIDTEKERNRMKLQTKYHLTHIRTLFASPKMAWSTIILLIISGTAGLSATLYNQFLPFIFASRGAVFGDGSVNTTYRNQVIISAVCIPPGFIAGWTVEQRFIGRKGTIAIAMVLAGTFLLASTTSRSSEALLGWNCGYAFFGIMMYSVLNSLPSEIFPTKSRGTGNGLVATARQLMSLVGPIIAIYESPTTSVPVYISGACIIFAGLLALLLPYETRGKASI